MPVCTGGLAWPLRPRGDLLYERDGQLERGMQRGNSRGGVERRGEGRGRGTEGNTERSVGAQGPRHEGRELCEVLRRKAQSVGNLTFMQVPVGLLW